MPPFVPPPNPPAQIETVPPDTQGKQDPLWVNQETQKDSNVILSQLPSEIPVISENDSTQATPPEVVEFYLSSPEEVPKTETIPALIPTGQAADVLGDPITAGKPGKGTSPQWVPLQLSETAGKSSQPRRLLLKPRGKPTKSLEFSLTPQPSKPLAQREVELFPDTTPQEAVGVVELVSDRQEYDTEKEVVYAEGKVIMRFANGVLLADRLWINLPDQFAVAQGNVVLDRGEQTLRGERFEYYFVQDSGVIFNANGEIYQPTTGRDFSPTLPTSADSSLIPNQTLNERLALEQPLQRITQAQGISYSFGFSLGEGSGQSSTPGDSGGQINRIRFEADRLEFDADGWEASNARLTNDPFSPPEVEVRAETATFRNIAPLVDEVKLTNSRVVLDQANSFPTQDRF